MLVTDASEWMANEKPQTFTVKVTNKLHNISSEVEILATGTNVLSSIELFGTQDKVCLKDGFYCFEVSASGSGCGKSYKTNRVFLANATCTVDHFYVKASKDEKIFAEELYQDLKMIDVNTKIGRLKEASSIYQTLLNKIKTIGCHECGC